MSLSTRLRAHFDAAGARFVDVPVLNPADVFLETAGEDIRRRMFVTEGAQGERLALRPDFTIPVCLMHLAAGAAAGRYAYEGLVFRRHDQGSPERPETGFEDIGREDRTAADAEALALAVACARESTDAALTVRIGDINLFTALLAGLGLPNRWRRRLRRSFGLAEVMRTSLARMVAPREVEERRLDAVLRMVAGDRDGLVALLAARYVEHGHQEGNGRTPAEIADRFLSQRALSDPAIAGEAARKVGDYLALAAPLAEAAAMLRRAWTSHGLAADPALAAFAARAEAIAALLPGCDIRFEAGFGRPLDYYTGLVFEIRAAGLTAPVVGGGRYDRLMEMLGSEAPVPAVGFTMRLDQATERGA
jgi:ATP phosphoribosyltransferase regulatory subunit